MNQLTTLEIEVGKLRESISTGQDEQITFFEQILDEIASGVVVRNRFGDTVFRNTAAKALLDDHEERIPFMQAFTGIEVRNFILDIPNKHIECDARKLKKPYDDFVVAVVNNGDARGLKLE